VAFRHPRPDGRDYKNKIIFTEVVKPERLVYRHAGEDEHEDVRFHVAVTFQAQGRKTLRTMRSLFATARERDEVVTKYGAIEGGKQTLERLAAHVGEKLSWAAIAATTTEDRHALCGWICRTGAAQEPERLQAHGDEGFQGLARSRRAGIRGMLGRRREEGKMDLISAQREA
jgi:hypothetical protein